MQYGRTHNIENMRVIGSLILTVSALFSSWPASVFSLIYYGNPLDTGAYAVAVFFALLSVILWGSAISGWYKVYKRPLNHST